MWWLTVGCDRPDGSTRSHAHTSSAGRGDERQQPEPDRIGQRGERLGQHRRPASSSSASARTGVQQASGSRVAVLRQRPCRNCIEVRRRNPLTIVDSDRHVNASKHRQCSVNVTASINGGSQCPVSSSPSTSDDLDASIEFYTKLFQDPARQDPRRLRQLRHRRAAAQAGADRRPGRARHAQPRRRRGRVHRRGRGGHRPHAGRGRGVRRAGVDDVLLRRAGQGVGPGPEIPWEIYTVLADAPSCTARRRVLLAEPPTPSDVSSSWPTVSDSAGGVTAVVPTLGR